MGVGVSAPETQQSITFALDNRHDLVEHSRWGLRAFDNVFAVWMRTPAEVGGIRDERRVE